jgi:DNA-binding winged helix-turn-helix (wHTH) protein
MRKCVTTKWSASGGEIRFGAFEFEPETGELRKHGLRIKLRGQPIEVLTMLLQHPGKTVTREELQRGLWPSDTYVDFEPSLNAAMKRLRAALCDSAGKPRFIETLAGRGYRFIAPVTQPAEEVPAPAATVAPNPQPDVEPARRPQGALRGAAIVAAAVLLIVTGLG